jgi:hypothetical protein
VDLYREFRLLRRVTFLQQLKKVTKKSRRYARRPVNSTGYPLMCCWHHAVKKLANNAQTVFTESSWCQQHINGLANARESQKQTTRNKTTVNKKTALNSDTVIGLGL